MSRRFTFSLRTLLLGMAIVAAVMAGGTWWVSWPQRRASQLVDVAASSPDEAEAMSPGSGMWQALRENPHDRPYLEAQPRSFVDVLSGRQVFTVAVPMHKKLENRMFDLTGTLTVTRGELRGPVGLQSRERKSDREN